MIEFYVDKGRSDAWRIAPYSELIRSLAMGAYDLGACVLVYVGKNTLLILPDRIQELGAIGPDEEIIIHWSVKEGVKVYRGEVLHKHDLKLQSMKGRQ